VIQVCCSPRLLLGFLFRFRPDGTCWGPLREILKIIYSWKRFPLCFQLDSKCWGRTFPKNQTFWKILHDMVGNIYFCELGCEQSYSSIDSELWAVTPAMDSWAVKNKFSKDLSCEQAFDQHIYWWLFSPISSISSEQKPLKKRLTTPTSSRLTSENKIGYYCAT